MKGVIKSRLNAQNISCGFLVYNIPVGKIRLKLAGEREEIVFHY